MLSKLRDVDLKKENCIEIDPQTSTDIHLSSSEPIK